MSVDDVLRHLSVEPAGLDPAPSQMRGRDAGRRIGRHPRACVGCGRPARVTGIIDVPAYGHRWLDRCRDCFLATVDLEPSRVPPTLEGILADLRAAAAEARVELRILVDERGDRSE
ncbi:hypothetical protein [Streptomyces spiralis]|uniref:hypothetical protein n=1 Tax=Streptomyces spiralis TaxID=66376 RepID=UPI003689DEFB